MGARAAQVVEQFLGGAAGLFEGVGKDRQLVESWLVVRGTSESLDSCRSPGSVEDDRAEGFGNMSRMTSTMWGRIASLRRSAALSERSVKERQSRSPPQEAV